jgi:transcriptional regulator with XRE-family HTH domain
MTEEHGERWSGYTLADKIGMSQGTAAYLLSSKPRNFRDTTLQAVARAFGCDIREVRAMAGQPAGESEPWVPPPEANQLNARERAALEQIIFVIHAAQGRYFTR